MESQIALAGNPNSGKTTLFNSLTGAYQHVGNYPGVTVEKKEGIYKKNGYRLYLVDLPGTYSLTVYSIEEEVTRNFLVNEKPEVVINVVDASNLERNLYLSIQFMEIGIPTCIALNMIDVAESYGIKIDTIKLSDLLGVPVIPIIAKTSHGLKHLMETVVKVAKEKKEWSSFSISYGETIDKTLKEIENIIKLKNFMTDIYPSRWIALKYLENDEHIIFKGRQENIIISDLFEQIVKNLSIRLQKNLDTYPETIIAAHRYDYIKSILKQGIIHHKYDPKQNYVSDKIDKIVVNRFLGPIIMIIVLFSLYHFTFACGEIPMQWLHLCFKWLKELISTYLPNSIIKSLIISAIIDGIGCVLGFVPLIMFMFLCIAVLEDSGYLARVAFMLDRIFRIFGMHGNSVISYIVSGGIAGGCAVPGVMAARTLKSPKERIATLLTAPFMNCGAKLPVLVLLIGTFFEKNKSQFLFIFTIISWIGAMLVAKFLRITIIKGSPTPFAMELPPYHLPSFKGVVVHTWERTWQYIKKAGTVILSISLVIWIMMNFPTMPKSQIIEFKIQKDSIINSFSSSVIQELNFIKQESKLSEPAKQLKNRLFIIDKQQAEEALKYSIAGRIGRSMEKISMLAGFDWRINIALISGFAAKELVISTLGTAYSMGKINSKDSLSLSNTLAKSSNWSPAVALSLIIFTMFYAPCFVTVICIVKEAGSWKWGLFSVVFNTMLAFFLSILVFQISSAII